MFECVEWGSFFLGALLALAASALFLYLAEKWVRRGEGVK